MKFTYYTIIGKDIDLFRGHISNVKFHAGFDRLTCEKEFLAIIYHNASIPRSTVYELLDICRKNNIRPVLYFEPPGDDFLTNLYRCWNLGYEAATAGFVFRSGSDQAFNKDSFPKLYDLACRLRPHGEPILLNTQTIEHAVRAMSRGNVSRHILADFGDNFNNFNVGAFESFCTQLNKGVHKEILTVQESIAHWGKPTPFFSTISPNHNRTEGCSWLILRSDWEKYGPLPRFRDGLTGDCWFHDALEKAGYKDYLTRDIITYHFFRGESIHRY